MSAQQEPQPAGSLAGIGDAAVEAKTGKSWSEWIAVLDAEHAKLPDAETVGRLKAFWAEKLQRLQQLLAAS